MKDKPTNHGGSRPGSGRNPSDDPKLAIPPLYIKTSEVVNLGRKWYGIKTKNPPTHLQIMAYREAVRMRCYEFLKQEAACEKAFEMLEGKL